MSSKAAATRLNILYKAFELIYRNGYRTTSVDQIIATTQVTKGAFFHHFKNKDEMGIAMIDEVMYPEMVKAFTSSLKDSDEPQEAIYLMMKELLIENPFFDVRYGCPAINLVEELASYSTVFHSSLHRLTMGWKTALSTWLTKGQLSGKIKSDVKPDDTAMFILSGYSGARNLGKVYGNQSYTAYLSQLRLYLNQL